MYLDPGSGSVIIQVILGSLFAIGIGVRVFWGRIKSAFSKNPAEQPGDDPDG